MKHFRPARVSDLIIEELNNIILREIEIPDVLITINDVEVTKDLEKAAVKISVYPSEKTGQVMKILEKNCRKMQYLLMKKINIKPMPKIIFQPILSPPVF
jgi:ribosome-binding factor A